MKIIKIEKNHCSACDKVSAFLDNSGVSYDTLNIHADGKEAEQGQAYLQELSLFTVPVTLVVNEEGHIVEYARGMDVDALQQLTEFVK